VDLVGGDTASIPVRAAGVCLFFGNEFQKLDRAAQSEWIDWSQTPGRVFLLLPPFQSGAITTLLDWEILSVGSVPDSMAPSIARRLSGEVRIQLKGTFQVPAKPSGTWDNGTVNTCFYRRHPHTGIFAVTCLPLWSLALLDAKTELRAWLAELLSLAGKPAEEEPQRQGVAFELHPEHYAVLLLLCSQIFSSDDEALKALAKSDLFQVSPQQARRYLTELETHGLAKRGQLTRAGRMVLAESSFEPFAAELEARTR
jgi:hypothetical protein